MPLSTSRKQQSSVGTTHVFYCFRTINFIHVKKNTKFIYNLILTLTKQNGRKKNRASWKRCRNKSGNILWEREPRTHVFHRVVPWNPAGSDTSPLPDHNWRRSGIRTTEYSWVRNDLEDISDHRAVQSTRADNDIYRTACRSVQSSRTDMSRDSPVQTFPRHILFYTTYDTYS